MKAIDTLLEDLSILMHSTYEYMLDYLRYTIIVILLAAPFALVAAVLIRLAK